MTKYYRHKRSGRVHEAVETLVLRCLKSDNIFAPNSDDYELVVPTVDADGATVEVGEWLYDKSLPVLTSPRYRVDCILDPLACPFAHIGISVCYPDKSAVFLCIPTLNDLKKVTDPDILCIYNRHIW